MNCLPEEHPREVWLWGREAAIGTSLYWRVHYRALRVGEWVSDSYSCSTEAWAKETADVMNKQTAHNGRLLYQGVNVTGPYIEWREVAWKYRDQ